MTLVRSEILTLGGLLLDVGEIDRHCDHLYVEGPSNTWDIASRCAIVELDVYEEEPPELDVLGSALRYGLDGASVREVARNLPPGLARSPEAFVRGLQYFDEFDSFIES